MSEETAQEVSPLTPETETVAAEPQSQQVSQPTGQVGQPETEDPKIPLWRFREVTAQKNQLQQQINQLSQDYERRWQEVLSKMGTPKEEESDVSFDENPAEYLKRQSDKISKDLSAAVSDLKQAKEDETREAQAANTAARIQQALTSDETEFTKIQPDYVDAANWFIEKRRAQLVHMGYSQAEIPHILARDSMYIVNRASQLGESPSSLFYGMIKQSGWKPTGKANSEPPKTLGGSNKEAVDADSIPSFKQLHKMNKKEFDAMFDRIMKGT